MRDFVFMSVKKIRLLGIWGVLVGFLIGCTDEKQPILRGKKHSVQAMTASHSKFGHDAGGQTNEPSNLTKVNSESNRVSSVSVSTNSPPMLGKADDADSMAIEKEVDQGIIPRSSLNWSLPHDEVWTHNSVNEKLDYAGGFAGFRQQLTESYLQHSQQVGQQIIEVSGKLLWDESEEARDKPLEEVLTGAEFEIRVRLP